MYFILFVPGWYLSMEMNAKEPMMIEEGGPKQNNRTDEGCPAQVTYFLQIPHTFTQCWLNVGPASQAVNQRSTKMGSINACC